MAGYCVAREIDISALEQHVRENLGVLAFAQNSSELSPSLANVKWKLKSHSDVLHLRTTRRLHQIEGTTIEEVGKDDDDDEDFDFLAGSSPSASLLPAPALPDDAGYHSDDAMLRLRTAAAAMGIDTSVADQAAASHYAGTVRLSPTLRGTSTQELLEMEEQMRSQTSRSPARSKAGGKRDEYADEDDGRKYYADTDDGENPYHDPDEVARGFLSEPEQPMTVEAVPADKRPSSEPHPSGTLERVDLFFFSFGSVVFWNFPTEGAERALLEEVLAADFTDKPFAPEAVDDAEDDMTYFYGERSFLKNDEVELGTRKSAEKLAFSFALAQSCLLSVFEWRLEQTITRNEHIPQELIAKGRIAMTQADISREVGRLFIERNGINLDSLLLDTPEVFWDNDEHEPVFRYACKYLEIPRRIEVVNTRLDVIRELLDVLMAQVDHQHASYLEWVIIWLIVIEVLLQVIWQCLFKDILGWFQHPGH